MTNKIKDRVFISSALAELSGSVGFVSVLIMNLKNTIKNIFTCKCNNYNNH
jgi:hypothetical protein